MALRAFYPAVTFVVLCLLLVTPSCGGSVGDPPHVLFIVIDTLRADRTSLHDDDIGTTPYMAMAGQGGVVFKQALSPASWTLPAMAGIFSGREITTRQTKPFPDILSLAERFQNAGYRTVGIVANPVLAEDSGFERGFDSYTAAPSRRLQEMQEDIEGFRSWNGDGVVKRAFAEIEKMGDEPLFLYLHFMDPHFPYDPKHHSRAVPASGWSSAHEDGSPPKAWASELRAGQVDLLCGWRRAYDGETIFADQAIGRLLAGIGVLEDVLPGDPSPPPVTKKTGSPWLLAITSDHGEGLFNHTKNEDNLGREGALGDAYGDHGEQLYEEAIRVPLLLAGPGVPKGGVEERAVSILDLGATLLELALGEEAADGVSLPLDETMGVRTVICGTGSRGWYARTEEWKLLVPFTNRSGVDSRLMAMSGRVYAEEIEDHIEIEKIHARGLYQVWEEWRETFAGVDSEPDAETIERLRAMGYVR